MYMSKQPKKTQTATQLSRTLNGQLSKQEKRSRAFIDITRMKRQAYLAVKTVRQAQFM
jgi:hypothetical protein